jgi:hypothetical protein
MSEVRPRCSECRKLLKKVEYVDPVRPLCTHCDFKLHVWSFDLPPQKPFALFPERGRAA